MARRSMRTVPQKLLCGLFEFFFQISSFTFPCEARAASYKLPSGFPANCQIDVFKEEVWEIVSKLMHENLGAKIRKS